MIQFDFQCTGHAHGGYMQVKHSYTQRKINKSYKNIKTSKPISFLPFINLFYLHLSPSETCFFVFLTKYLPVAHVSFSFSLLTKPLYTLVVLHKMPFFLDKQGNYFLQHSQLIISKICSYGFLLVAGQTLHVCRVSIFNSPDHGCLSFSYITQQCLSGKHLFPLLLAHIKALVC